ncbi:1-pyrroline-5-carboxylate dehydrogenase [Petrotoga sp. 9T1HF07.CasAA.8.2]|uniref:L-glutamate gamma-semialdehyde dehydrogenase n=1 Tax=Petrotoga sp. 9T1HF07.CasAA.8.2 TaxID=1434329 RepID=UPI000CAD876F|nr:L-glutamate gamma-semialdehyde dehydrogenase [Petrotoga sp. 9T1HF07.CasAA.8.2]PNR89460.1 1-pyrroline-5-carboxylate dehydrogenase [Petrotoga sp. 9T1HF07.CasAA.8.2]
MNNSIPIFEMPENEPILNYEPGSKEKKELKEKLSELKSEKIEIPLIIGGKEVRTGDLGKCVMPHDHRHVLAEYHKASEKEVAMAIESSLEAKKIWDKFSWADRLSIFKKAAELLSTNWRSTLNAATMLGQSKNVFQAEIDSACELTDFLRFNSYYATKIYMDQPKSTKGVWNRLEYRPLEGFVFAVTPFNFTSIAGNLPTAPAIMGNTVLWKPASSAVYSAYFFMKLLQEAGLPDGVINFIPGSGSKIGSIVFKDPNFTGLHFTGSAPTFQNMWETIGKNIRNYKTYPRIVGETGGKDFVIAHESSEIETLATALIRGAFEYQGQKCSAVSRAYIPNNIWPKVKENLIENLKEIKIGSPENFTNFMNAVIDKEAFDKIKSYIDFAKESNEAEIIYGGKCDDSIGYFIEPTVILTTNPKFKTMEEEIFGPVLSIYVYDAKEFDSVLKLCDETSPYGLTGAIFAQDRNAIKKAEEVLVNAAGNFYINDKPTGAVVAQQPFGGSRASGTNDKAGSVINLLRWVSTRAIKENFAPPKDFKYPFMKEE